LFGKERVMKDFLEVNDVFELCDGHTVYTEVAKRFAYDNRPYSWDTTETEITVGRDTRGLDTGYLRGTYIVTATSMSGGRTGELGDVYPNGHHVRARKVEEGQVTDCEVTFYQSGSFTAMIYPHNIEKVGTGRPASTVEIVDA
jgi:hypothetical protein